MYDAQGKLNKNEKIIQRVGRLAQITVSNNSCIEMRPYRDIYSANTVPCNPGTPSQQFSLNKNSQLVSMLHPDKCLFNIPGSRWGWGLKFHNCAELDKTVIDTKDVDGYESIYFNNDPYCLFDNKIGWVVYDSCIGYRSKTNGGNPITFLLNSTAPSGTYLENCLGCYKENDILKCSFCYDKNGNIKKNQQLNLSQCGPGDVYNEDGTLNCPVKLSDWFNDGECMFPNGQKCGEGTQIIKRNVIGGKGSSEILTSTKPCFVKCPNCFENRTEWSECDSTGKQSRTLADLDTNGVCKVSIEDKDCPVDCVIANEWGECIPNSGICGIGKQYKKIITEPRNNGKECGRTQKPCKIECKTQCKAKNYASYDCIDGDISQTKLPPGEYQTLYSDNATIDCVPIIYQPCSKDPLMIKVAGTELCGRVEPHKTNDYGAQHILATASCDKNDPRQLFTINNNLIKSNAYEDLCMYAGHEWNKGWGVKFGPCKTTERVKYFGNTKENKLYSTLANMCVFNNKDYAMYDDCNSTNPNYLSLQKM